MFVKVLQAVWCKGLWLVCGAKTAYGFKDSE